MRGKGLNEVYEVFHALFHSAISLVFLLRKQFDNCFPRHTTKITSAVNHYSDVILWRKRKQLICSLPNPLPAVLSSCANSDGRVCSHRYCRAIQDRDFS